MAVEDCQTVAQIKWKSTLVKFLESQRPRFAALLNAQRQIIDFMGVERSGDMFRCTGARARCKVFDSTGFGKSTATIRITVVQQVNDFSISWVLKGRRPWFARLLHMVARRFHRCAPR